MTETTGATEVDWTDAEPAPPKKRGIPKWIWFGCGCGCLLTVITIAVLGFFVREMFDPEVQWPKLQEVLHFEERPSDLKMAAGIPIPGAASVFTLLNRAEGYQVTVFSFSKSVDERELDQMFSETPQKMPMGIGEPTDPELVELEVQGRTVRAIRYSGVGLSSLDGLGEGIRVDLSDEEHGARMVDMRAMGTAELTDELIEEFFSLFEVWE